MSTKKRGQDKVFQRIIGSYTFKSDNSDRTSRDARSPTNQEKMCPSSLADRYMGQVLISERLKGCGLQIVQSLETVNQRKGFRQDTQRKGRNRQGFARVVGEELL
jgi:hypothetical protein